MRLKIHTIIILGRFYSFLRSETMKIKKNLTIFTPIFNRAYIIRNLYESLCRQTNKNFIWLVVNDGSTDNVDSLIKSFINERKLEIQYIKQKNSGKHVAHNTAVKNCKTEMFVCVDSDDYLTDDAVQTIYDEWENIQSNEKIAGILGLRGSSPDKPLGTWIPNGLKTASIFDLYEKFKFKGDTILVFKTSVLKNYYFPVFGNEKFVTEAVIYDQISQKYEMKLVNKILYICKYLDDGLTKNINTIHRQNPNGYIYFLNQRIKFARSFGEKYKAVSNYVAGCIRIKRMDYFFLCNYSLLKYFAIPRGLWIYIKPLIKNRLLKIQKRI